MKTFILQLLKKFQVKIISIKLIIGFFLVSLTLPLSISFFLINFSNIRLNQYILNRNEKSMETLSSNIENYFDNIFNICRLIAMNHSVINENKSDLNLFFYTILNQYPIFRSISLFKIEGNEMIYSSAFKFENSQELNLIKASIEADKKVTVGQFQMDEQNQPILYIYYPVIRLGKIQSLIVVEINMIYVWTLIDNIKLGEYGNALLIDNQGRIIAHKNKDLILNSQSLSPEQFEKLKSENKTAQISFDDENLSWSLSQILNPKWYLIIEQKDSELNEIVNEMTENVAVFLIFTIAVIGILSIYVMKKMMEPIDKLIEGVKNFADGKLEGRISVKSNDELEDLAKEFNKMASTLHENEKKLRRMERISAMTKFIRVISHEIRNPLNAMTINMQILKRELNKDAPNREKENKYADIISSEITRMDNLIATYTSLSQAPQFTLQYHDVNVILEEIVFEYQAQAEIKNIQLNLTCHQKEIIVQIDRNQIKQVFINLIINALQAIENERGFIHISSSIENNHCIINISDNGIGIDEQHLDDIFEFYYTSKLTGSGIGLSLAKQIIEGHNGKISVNSHVNEGTEFTIKLPMVQEL